MIIEVLKPGDTEEDESEVIEKIEISKIDTSRIIPVNETVANPPIPIQELSDLIRQIQPIEPLKLEEPDAYYARNIEAWRDDNLSSDLNNAMDIPHHIGLRVVLAGVYQKYGTSDNLLIHII